MSQSFLRQSLVLVTIGQLSSAGRCPDGQFEHAIADTYERRCCYPFMVEIGYEFVICSVNGSNDTQRPCGPGLFQPDQTSSENEPMCFIKTGAHNCNSFDTKIVQDGASKKCICNLDAGFCGPDHSQCKEIRSINCAGHKVDQNCTCILTNPLQPISQDRTEETKTTNSVVNTTSPPLPTEQTPAWTDGKTPELPYSRGEHDVNNAVNNNVSSNSNNNLSIILPSVLVPCILGLLGLLFYLIRRWRRSHRRHTAVYSQLHKNERNDSEAGTRDEETSIPILRRQDSKVPVQSSSTSSIEKIPEAKGHHVELRESVEKDHSKDLPKFRRGGTTKDLQIAVVPPTVQPREVSTAPAIIQPREASTAPACPASDISATTQDPADPASVHSVEELPRPELHSIPCPSLFTGSMVSTDVDRISGEVIRAPQSPETSVTQQAGESSEVSQSMEVSLTQETRQVTAASAANARMPSDFRHNTDVKEYRTNSGQIQELTKGKATTFDGVAEFRAELPVSVPCLEGSTKIDSEDTELKVVKHQTGMNCSQRTGVQMDGTDMPFANEPMQYGLRNELELESLAKTEATSNTSILADSNVVSDPLGAQQKVSAKPCKNDDVRSKEMAKETNGQLQNPFPSNYYQALGIPNLLPSFMSADSLYTDSDEDEKYE